MSPGTVSGLKPRREQGQDVGGWMRRLSAVSRAVMVVGRLLDPPFEVGGVDASVFGFYEAAGVAIEASCVVVPAVSVAVAVYRVEGGFHCGCLLAEVGSPPKRMREGCDGVLVSPTVSGCAVRFDFLASGGRGCVLGGGFVPFVCAGLTGSVSGTGVGGTALTAFGDGFAHGR